MKYGQVLMVVLVAVFGLHMASAAYNDKDDCKDIGNNCAQLKAYCSQLDTLLYCPATCGVCGTPVPTPSPAPTPKPKAVFTEHLATEECKDLKHPKRCAYLAQNGRCGEQKAQEDCPLTCGICFASPTPTPVPGDECVDIMPASTCSYRAGLGQCGAFKVACAKTCGFCIPKEDREVVQKDCRAKKTTVCIAADTNLPGGADQWGVVGNFVDKTLNGIFGNLPEHDRLRFASVIFGDSVYRAKGPAKDGSRMAQLLQRFNWRGASSSRMDLALGTCQKAFEHRPREDEERVVILISNGDNTLANGEEVPKEKILEKADELKDAGVKVYSVGFDATGNDATEELLKSISGVKDSADPLYTTVESVHDFNSFAGELVSEECPGDV